MKSVLISIEGIDGCGKSYAAEYFKRYYNAIGYHYTAPPYANQYGLKVKPPAIVSQNVSLGQFEVIPALLKENVETNMVLDRFILSKLVYGKLYDQIDPESLRTNAFLVQCMKIMNDITKTHLFVNILVQSTPENAITRIKERESKSITQDRSDWDKRFIENATLHIEEFSKAYADVAFELEDNPNAMNIVINNNMGIADFTNHLLAITNAINDKIC